MTKGGHLTSIAGLLAGLGIFLLPLTATAQVYPGQASYYANGVNGFNGLNGLNNQGRHLGWEHRRHEMMEAMGGGGGCHHGFNGMNANPLAYQNANQYANQYGLSPYSAYSPVAGNGLLANGILGNSFQPLNGGSLLGLTTSQERAYMKNSKSQISQMLNSGQISPAQASLLKSQLKAAENYYYNNNGGSGVYNGNNPLAAFNGSNGLLNGYSPYNTANSGALGRLRGALGL